MSVSLLILSACHYPVTTLNQVSSSATLSFLNTPPKARVFIDNQSRGYAVDYDEKKSVLSLSEGRHSVRIEDNGNVLYDKEIYIVSGAHIKINLK